MSIKQEINHKVSYEKDLEYKKADVSWCWVMGMFLSTSLLFIKKTEIVSRFLETYSLMELNYSLITYGLLAVSYWKVLGSINVKMKPKSIEYIKNVLERNEYTVLEKKEDFKKAVYGIYLSKDGKEYFLSDIVDKEFIITQI